MLKKIVKYVFYPSIISIFILLLKKMNIITCMKVTGETFSFLKKKKRSRRGKIPKVFKLSGKRTVTGQNSGVVKRGHSSFMSLHFMPGKK